MSDNTVLAIDLGAESGRVMAVHFNGRSLTLDPIHRFSNPITQVSGVLHWDFLHLWREITVGIEKGKAHKPISLGIDTWGVDFGLLDKAGQLIGNPVNYRDPRTKGMMEAVFAKVPKTEVFAQTGVQFLSINSLYQMMSLVVNNSPQLDIAHTFLTAPDLLNYWLTGAKVCEFSNVTTTQMFNPITGTWATEMMDRLGIPTHIFPEIVQPGTRLGEFEGIPVIAPACHDTGSAVAAIPTHSDEYAYISSGTWSLVGLEVRQPIMTLEALKVNATNEGGVNNSYRFLKNLMGLWLLQQCRQTWADAGRAYSYEQLVALAKKAPSSPSIFDVNNGRFLTPGNLPQRIQALCGEEGLPIPQTDGEISRALLDSMAVDYAQVIDELTAVAQQPVKQIHIVGGGTQNSLLNQLTANATGLPVVTGPIEATVLGNAIVQLIAQRELANLAEARQLIGEMGVTKRYEPN